MRWSTARSCDRLKRGGASGGARWPSDTAPAKTPVCVYGEAAAEAMAPPKEPEGWVKTPAVNSRKYLRSPEQAQTVPDIYL